MSISAPFISRPVATVLLTIAVALAGIIGYTLLPVSPLPQVDFPTVQVNASLPGASPDTMASSVATPLERQFGRIAGVSEMTSTSSLGSTQVTMQFDLSRNIDAAARDVQAAVNAARGQLPPNLPSNPTYKKVNPADAPVLQLAMTSDVVDKPRMYDLASSILQQRIAQIPGVGQVVVGGGALPAVRVDVNPTVLNTYGLSLDDVRKQLAAANANEPKGELSDSGRTWSLATSDQLFKAKDYRPIVLAYVHGAALHLSDVANVQDSVEDVRNTGLANGKPAVLLIIYRQPGANIIDTVDRIKALLPALRASLPPTVALSVALDRTTTIRASVRDVELTMAISIALVILVVFVFLRSVRSTLIPMVAVPVSLLGTFGVMYLFGYSLDNLSLMALTIATGFVVDDAIVVIENITRHLEAGMAPRQAALRRRQGNRLHRGLDQRVARGGVHSDSVDGRHRRPPVPRIRGDAGGRHLRVDAHLADDHARDVRLSAQTARRGAARLDLSRQRAGVRVGPGPLRTLARLGAAASGPHAARWPWSRWRPRSISTSSSRRASFPSRTSGASPARSRRIKTPRSRPWRGESLSSSRS